MMRVHYRQPFLVSKFLTIIGFLSVQGFLVVDGFSQSSSSSSPKVTPSKTNTGGCSLHASSFSVPLETIRPQPESASEQFWSLWNDKRSIGSLIRDSTANNNDEESSDSVPYCIVSDEFQIDRHSFQVLLYPRGVYSSTDQPLRGTPASAYLRYLPKEYGDEIDVSWKLRLCSPDGALPIETSGGLPRSSDTWSAAMTFCAPNEAVDSVGRTNDWGSSIWNSQQVCECIEAGDLCAEGEITIWDSRTGESSFSFPPKGAIRAVQDTMKQSTSSDENSRIFRAGEIIVTVPQDEAQQKELRQLGIYSGVDYRVMTLSDEQGNEIFSTESCPETAQLALRPVGWKLQQQLWQTRGLSDWPVSIPAKLLTNNKVALSRFDLKAFLPRFGAFLTQDLRAVLFALTIAIAPIPLALIGREFFSFYAIPSASMDPTLQNGDVLLVEKLPRILDRTKRGDIILFKPPTALQEIVQETGGRPISSNQLFVKRIVGMPGDANILMDDTSQEVSVNGQPAVGPNRNLCADEPLRLIDKLLDGYGAGKSIGLLNEDETYVLGDCKAVSVDSRVFGSLPKQNIVGKPVARIWPLNRFTVGSP